MKRKIIFLNRSDRYNAYSIENLFRVIFNELQKRLSAWDIAQVFVDEKTESIKGIWCNIKQAYLLRADLIHVTGDIHYVVPFIRKAKVALTIHDIVPLTRFSRSGPKYWLFYFFWYRWPMMRSDVITVVSEKTKQDLIEIFGDRYPIKVVPNFVDPIFQRGAIKPMNATPQFLIIGGASHKNVLRSVQAVQAFGSGYLRLIGEFGLDVLDALQNGNFPYTIEFGLSQEAILEAYQQADLLLFPTLFEGFGLPILEAQACGCPVITSKISPMMEVAGDAAFLVDPSSVDAIRIGIAKILLDDDYRIKLIAKGLENVKKYELAPIAQAYEDLYSELLLSN